MMFNPFAENAEGQATDAELVELAKNGDRAALEKLVLRHQAWIYNIAVRMVFQPQDAEEVTQEVLIKVITKLSTFKGREQVPHLALPHCRQSCAQHEAPQRRDKSDDVRRLWGCHRQYARS